MSNLTGMSVASPCVFLLALLVSLLGSLSPCEAFSTQVSIPRNIHRLQNSHLQASSQVLEFEEPTTGVTVKLVGCMHYNPASIKLTEDTINELARDNKLGSVVIESCDIRWNQTKALPPQFQLQSEMKAACELAMDTYQRPVVLGDQRINITVSSLKQGFKETFVDLLTPWNGGWGRLVGNVTSARKEALPFGDPYLNAFSFLDPKLLLAAPVSLIKYPLSYLIKSPIKTTIALTVLFLLDQEADATMVTVDEMTTGDWAGSLGVSLAEIALFGRVFLKELLAQRNVLLARNILEQCKMYQAGGQPRATKPSFWSMLTGSTTSSSQAMNGDTMEEIIYVPGAIDSNNSKNDNQEGKAVVAVLGMAHCNGIMKLLKEQRV
ncbi:expressed unknown protein [Seminavis robusta]|uniref:TraB domain-containing protein n=1 Tax=Seminavis robusta TaxID=568900 RepID=A0A9N8HJP5_9STRA|nr:expressed unknown protein [Seminavis robusta]|eukprot:Sro702_g189890.1 n/a (379) ;mRNA; f:10440-11576